MAQWSLRVGTSLGILVYIVLTVHRDHLWRAITGVHLEWVAIAVALYLEGQALSAFKWWLIGRSVGLPGSLVEYGRFYFIGTFFNLVGISTISGDIMRGIYLGRGRRPGLALSSVLFDRVSGLAVLMGMGSVALLAYPQFHFGGALTLLSAGILAGGLVLVVSWWACPRLVELLPSKNRLRRQVETELAVFWHDRTLLLRVAIVSVAFHLSQVCVQWLLGKAVGVTLPFAYCLVFHPMLAVMTTLPVSVSGFGVREGGYLFFLGLIDVNASIAITIGLLWWAVTLVVGLLGGVLFLASGGELPRVHIRSERTDAGGIS